MLSDGFPLKKKLLGIFSLGTTCDSFLCQEVYEHHTTDITINVTMVFMFL